MEKKKFIYVFGVEDKNKLLSLGYDLIKSDDKQDIYVFCNPHDEKKFTYDMNYVFSDTLTF